MTRVPRDVSGARLANALARFGYVAVRQSGSHLRLKTDTNGTHLITVPLHDSLRVGLLTDILDDVAAHAGTARDALIEVLRL